MAYFSIKGMLQKSLNAVFCNISAATDASPVVAVTSRTPSPAIPLHLRRSHYPIEYISPLPLLLPSHHSQLASKGVDPVEALLRQLWQHPLDRPLALSPRWQPIVSSIQFRPHTSGQLLLQLEQAALLPWLQGLCQPSTWPLVDAPTLQASHLIAPTGSLNKALMLSPLALVQQTHARCCSLLIDCQLKHGACKAAKQDRLPWVSSAATCALLWELVNLLDVLAADPSPQTLLRQGCQLSEAVYEWLRQWPQLNADLAASTTFLLQAVQQALQHLLEQHLGAAALAHI